MSLPLIATVAQEIISLYTLWDRYKEDLTPQGQSPYSSGTSTSPSKRSMTGSRSASVAGTPVDAGDEASETSGEADYVTPSMVSALLLRMRESWLTDMSRGGNGRPVAVNKMWERTQAAG